MPDMADTYPEIFDGYRIVKPAIGHGGAGVVHKAIASDGQHVAIKVLDRKTIEARLLKRFEERRESTGGDSTEPTEETRRAYEKYVERFKEEYHVLVGLDHPNIARVHHIGFYEGQFYIVSEFVDGKPIAEYVRGWEPMRMIPFFIQALNGLDFIHRNGLIHLDIKSENILVCENRACAPLHLCTCENVSGTGAHAPRGSGAGFLVKLIDFGLAMQPADYTGGFMGSVPTMAPEVALGLKEQVDARADLYSIGSVMYQCITWGSFPFIRPGKGDREAVRRAIEREGRLRAYSLSSAHHSRPGLVPEFLDTIVMRLLAHKPEDRLYSNARAVINALTTHMPDAFQDTPETRGAYLKPERGKYIGRDKEVALVEENIQLLIDGKGPAIPVFCITGGDGMGKTYFLKHLRDMADRHVETISIHSFAFPANEDAIEEKTTNLSQRLAENAKPVLVLIDNLQELPANSKVVAVIGGLIRLIIERRHKPAVYAGIQPAMFVLTTTAQIAWITNALDRDVDAMKTIELKPFDTKDVETYLLSTPALQGKELPQERVDALYRRTSGVPGELEDTLEALDERGVIFDADGQIVLADMPPSLQKIPGSTRDRLLAGYHALTPAERHIVDVMACWCLKPFLPPLRLDDISAFVQSQALTQTLHALAQMDFIEYDRLNDTYAFFDRDYAPELIHEEMDKEKREQLHSLIADHFQVKPKPDKNAIRYHRALGADKKTALRSCIFLGRDFLYHEGKCRVAIELFERALGLTDSHNWKLRAYILSLLAEAFFYDGQTGLSSHAIEEGLELVAGKTETWMVAFSLKKIAQLLQAKKLEDMRTVIDNVAPLRMGLAQRITLLNYEAAYYHRLASLYPNRAVEFLHKAREICEESGRIERDAPRFDIKLVKNSPLYLVQRSLGNLDAARISLEQRIEQREPGVLGLATSYAELADVCRMERLHDKALRYASQSLEAAQKAMSPRLLFHAHRVAANVYHDMDVFDKSLEELNRQLASSACIDDKQVFKNRTVEVWTHMGHCHKELSHWDKATIYFDAAISDGNDPDYLMSAYQGLGEVCFHKGDFDRELELFAKAEKLLDDMPINAMTDSHRYRIARLKVETFLRKNNIESARHLMPVLKQLAGNSEEKIKECEELGKKVMRLGGGFA